MTEAAPPKSLEVVPGSETKSEVKQKEETELTPALAKETVSKMLAGLRSSKSETEKKPEPEKKELEKKEEKKKEELKVEDKVDDKKKEEPPDEKKAVKTARAKPARKEMDMGELAETIATASTKAATEAVLKKSQEKTDSQTKSAERSATLRAFDELKRIMPDKYGSRDFEAEATEAKRAWKAYETDWKEKNPGEKFDAKAQEHSEFHESLEPEYDEDDFDRAKSSLDRAPIVEKQTKLEKELEELRAELVQSKITPTIQSEVGNAVNEIARTVVETVTPDAKGKPATAEAIKKWSEDYPDAVEEIQNAIKSVEPFVSEVVKLYEGRGRYAFNENNPVHVELAQFAAHLESNLDQADPEQTTMEDGRQFATRDAYARMTPSQQARHWIVGRNELIRAKTAEIASQAAKKAEIIEGRYKTRLERAISKNGSGEKSNGTHTEKVEEKKVEAKEIKPEPVIPDGGSRSVSQSTEQGGAGGQLTEMQRIAAGWRSSLK